MKPLITIIVVLFSIAACTASCGKDDQTTPAPNNEAGNYNASATKMKITVGTAVLPQHYMAMQTLTSLRQDYRLPLI